MSTPLYSALTDLCRRQPLRMAMPGHKGKPISGLEDFAAIDFTELSPTGNLYEEGGPVEAAERLWADAWGADACLFLTGGSTQGIHTALSCAVPPGNCVLVDRVSHRSIHTGLALLDLHPVWLQRPWLPDTGVFAPLPPETVARALDQSPDLRAVLITSPTYYGVLSDVDQIAEICHAHHVPLIVDAAHGAHLFLTGENPYRAADLVVTSAHKTLRAPGQSALLFANSPFSLAQLRQNGLIFGTSSPSYPMMAALDCLRAYYQRTGQSRYRETCRAVEQLRRDYPSLTPDDVPLDPARFVLCVPDGCALRQELEQSQIYPELAEPGHVVFILTDCDEPDDIARLRRALDAFSLHGAPRPRGAHPTPPPLPDRLCSPRTALFGPQEVRPLEACEGAVAAEMLAPYPPGVPVVAPGERIGKKALSYFANIGYNKNEVKVLRRI